MKTRLSFYLAGDFARRAELEQIALQIEEAIPELSSQSSWLAPRAAYNDDATGDGTMTPEQEEAASKAAVQDYNDIRESEIFIQFTTGLLHRGGRTAELGIAIAAQGNWPHRQVLICGPKEQIFHYHPGVIQLQDQRGLVSFLRGYLAGRAEV